MEHVSIALKKSQKEIVESALDFYFDYTDSVVADKVMEDIQNKKTKVVDSKDVYKELGIEI